MLNKNIEKLISAIKLAGKRNVAYDHRGRLIIKTKKINTRSGHRLAISNDTKIQPVLKMPLLYPEDRVIKQPVIGWARQLSANLRGITAQANPYHSVNRIAEIYNHAAFIFFAVNDIAAAREICYSQIQLFIEAGHWHQQNEYLKYIVQPWINLSRIDRLEGNPADAMNKLQLLKPVSQSYFVTGAPVKQLQLAVRDDAEISQVAAACALIEPIKIYLQSRQYQAAIDLAETRLHTADKSIMAFVYEALIVAYANLGHIDKAFDLLDVAMDIVHPGILHLFKLRECELMVCLQQTINDGDITGLCKLAEQLLCAKYVGINDIIYGLHVAYTAHMAGCHKESTQLGYYCLTAADNLNDEVLQAESLSQLYQWVVDADSKKIIEDLMICLYHKTFYHIARERMSRCFNELEHVERHQDSTPLAALMDELLSFKMN